jgi:hypothetical protein
VTRTQLAAIRDGAMERLGGESRYAASLSHQLVTLYNFGPEPLRRCVNIKSNQQRVIRALLAAYDAEVAR